MTTKPRRPTDFSSAAQSVHHLPLPCGPGERRLTASLSSSPIRWFSGWSPGKGPSAEVTMPPSRGCLWRRLRRGPGTERANPAVRLRSGMELGSELGFPIRSYARPTRGSHTESDQSTPGRTPGAKPSLREGDRPDTARQGYASPGRTSESGNRAGEAAASAGRHVARTPQPAPQRPTGPMWLRPPTRRSQGSRPWSNLRSVQSDVSLPSGSRIMPRTRLYSSLTWGAVFE